MAEGSMPKTSIMLPTFAPFIWESEPETAGIKWKRYKIKFENFMDAMEITNDARKRTMLIHYIGDAANELLETLAISERTYQATIEALDKHFMPIQNTVLEVYNFRQMKQRSDEPIEQFNTRLKKAANTCAFTNINEEIKAQIIMGTTSSKVRKHAIQTPELSLEGLLKYARASEISEKHNAQIEACSLQNVNWIKPEQQKSEQRLKGNPEPRKTYKQTENNRSDRTKRKDECLNCGREWHREGLKACKARGQTCRACGKPNHFAKVCMSKGKFEDRKQQGKETYRGKSYNKQMVAQIEDNNTSETEFIFAIYTKQNKKQGEITLKIGETPVIFTIDSGATVNLMSLKEYKRIKKPPILNESTKQIFAYGQQTPLKMAGQFQTALENRGKKTKSIFYVAVADGPSLLCKQTSLELELIKFECNINNLTAEPENISKIEQQYPRVFAGIGRHNRYKVKIHINKNIVPVANKYRRLPFHVRDKVEQELHKLVEQDIIERIPDKAPTPWISPIVVVPKKSDPKQIRICIDMRHANKAIIRERHVTPTIEDIKYELNGASWFSKLDLNQGYHQLEIEPKSRYITTFATHIGLFRYKRLNFGICSASEVFQYVIAQIVEGIPGAVNISDDILIFGQNKLQHDTALNKTLAKLSETGITLNKSKCIFNKTSLNFFGQNFTKGGTTTDSNRVKAIKEMGIPQSPAEVRSLLGMCNFCARYIPNLATISQPLRELTRMKAVWKWEDEEQDAYEEMMSLLSKHTQLSYFNKSRNTEIWTDASPTGIGAILVQREGNKHRIISFASRTLTHTETRYSQIEREALAIVWAMEHYRIYILGAEFVVVTDHKPLVPLFTNPNAKLSPRLERWCLKIQQYGYKMQYRQGKENPADYLSRHPMAGEKTSKMEEIAREYANFIAMTTIPKDIAAAEVRKYTLSDPTIQQVMENLRTGRWDKDHKPGINKKHMAIFYKIRNELTSGVDDSVLLRGYRIVMPLELQERTIDIAHTGHLGITKTKQLIRHKTWFPQVDRKVEDKLKHCIQCLAATPSNKTTPLEPSELPTGPWQYLHIDHKGPLPSGEYILTIIDLYSRFPVLEIVNSTAAKCNIQKLDSIFALLGTPETVCTDNGPPFNSKEFEIFVKGLGIRHRRVIPLWPRANGEVERFHRTLSKTLQIAHGDHQEWKKALNNMLRMYRAAPHCGTKIPPAELLLNRKVKMGLPTLPEGVLSETISREKLEITDEQAKYNNKTYFDRHHQLIENMPQEGDKVLAKRERQNKTQTPFDKEPYIVKETNGPKITAERPGHTITRHASQFKIIPDREKEDLGELVSPETKGKTQPEGHDNKDLEGKEEDCKLEDQNEENGLKTPRPMDSDNGKSCRTHRDTKPPKRLIEEC